MALNYVQSRVDLIQQDTTHKSLYTVTESGISLANRSNDIAPGIDQHKLEFDASFRTRLNTLTQRHAYKCPLLQKKNIFF